MTKRILSGILCIILLLSMVCFPAMGATTASGVDKKYWPLQSEYNTAVEKNDIHGIITAGTKIIALFVKRQSAEIKAAEFSKNGDTMEISILYPTYLKVAESYEKNGDTENAVKYYKELLPFALAFQKTLSADRAKDFEFLLSEIKNKIRIYDVDVSFYTETETSLFTGVYHGAKNEPRSGIYYGTAFSGMPTGGSLNTLIDSNNKTSSGELIYVIFEDEKMRDFDWIFKRAVSNHSIVEVAWNLKNEGESLKGVLSESAKIKDAANYLKGLGIPVILRFGAEMNVWEKEANSSDFIAAFQFVWKIMKQNAPNVAMCWSPNSISAAGKNYEMFYPGDEFVDWVGISLYSMKYFLGNKNQTESTQAIYGTGNYANPLAQAKPIIDAYGSKKPIMFSECGVENYSVTNKEDLTSFAVPQMQLLYGYAPIIYPELKAMFYFDKNFGDQSKNRFSIYDNDVVNRLYLTLTDNEYFISAKKDSAEISYKKLGRQTVPANKVVLYTYAPYLFASDISVVYSIDGKTLSKSSGYPLKGVFDLSGYQDGSYTLKAEVRGNGSSLKTKTIAIQKNGANVVLGSDKAATGEISEWAIPEVSKAITKALVPQSLQSGYKNDITRADFCTLAVTFLEKKSGKTLDIILKEKSGTLRASEGIFKDTSDKTILSAYALGIVNGKGEGVFDPNGKIKRQEAAGMLKNAAALLIDTEQSGNLTFADRSEIESWAIDGVLFASSIGVMGSTGDNKFSPNATFTREQAYITMLRMFDKMN